MALWTTQDPKKDILDRVKIDPVSGCWICVLKPSKSGYVKLVRVHGGEQLAHRRSYEAFIGSIPEGMLVCHKCDVRNCLNPEHLFLGTYADNSHDMMRKGRAQHGLLHPWHKIPVETVQQIAKDPRPSRLVAKVYGTSKSHVLRMRSGQHWTSKDYVDFRNSARGPKA